MPREPLVEEGEQLPAGGALAEEAAGEVAFHLHSPVAGPGKARPREASGKAPSPGRQRERRRRKPTGAWIPLVLLPEETQLERLSTGRPLRLSATW